MEKLTEVLIKYLTETVKEVKKRAANGSGREVLGEVINRPEDLEIGIDRVGENILEKILKESQIKATIYSEPEARDIENGNDFYGAIDPFDNSILFLHGFEHNWYTALSFYTEDKKPIATGVADILNERFYIMDNGRNYSLDMKTGEKKDISPSKRKSISEPVIIATYLMQSVYSTKFLEFFGDLVKNMHAKALLYPYGGSFIYSYLAAGLIDAYIMFDEPRSEIDPGFPIAKAAGCPVVSVDSDGRYRDYEFLPGRQHDKVDLLIATSTPEIRDQLIKEYVKKYDEKYSFRA